MSRKNYRVWVITFDGRESRRLFNAAERPLLAAQTESSGCEGNTAAEKMWKSQLGARGKRSVQS